MPEGTETEGWYDAVLRLLKGAYGLKDAPLLWALDLFGYFKDVLNYEQSVLDESVFYMRCEKSGELLVMWVHRPLVDSQDDSWYKPNTNLLAVMPSSPSKRSFV